MTTMIEHKGERGRASYLEAMSRVASTVSIVTTDGPAGRAGVTVSSLVSVSADSPLPTILVCIHESSTACPVIPSNGVFCVNALRGGQVHLSDTFAGRTGPADNDRFTSADWSADISSAPRLIDPLVAFDCRVEHSELVGLHHVIFGEVQDLSIGNPDEPLIYANRAYGTPTMLALLPKNSAA